MSSMICQHFLGMLSERVNHFGQWKSVSHLTQERKLAMADQEVLVSKNLTQTCSPPGVSISCITKTAMELKYQPKSSTQIWQMPWTLRAPAFTSASTIGETKVSTNGVQLSYNHGVLPSQLAFTHLRTTHGRLSKVTFSRTCSLPIMLAQVVSTIQDLSRLAGTPCPTTRKKHILHYGPFQKHHCS